MGKEKEMDKREDSAPAVEPDDELLNKYKSQKDGKDGIDISRITGARKSAIMLVALGSETASEVMKSLSEDEIETITLEIAELKSVTSKLRDAVIEEFTQMILAKEYIASGGIDYAREVLEAAVGHHKAMEIINRIQSTMRKEGFKLLREVDPVQLSEFVRKEHPQTIALILANLNPMQSSAILSEIPEKLQVDVITRLATLQRISPYIINEVEGILESQIKALFGQADVGIPGGVQLVAQILNSTDRTTERNVLSTLERVHPELALEIKQLMFVFEDIMLLDDRSIQRVLKEVDMKELSLALKGTSEEVKVKISRNMSSRAADMIKEDMEYMGPVKVKDVEDSQQKIVDIIRRLEEEGEVVISGRGGGGDELVE